MMHVLEHTFPNAAEVSGYNFKVAQSNWLVCLDVEDSEHGRRACQLAIVHGRTTRSGHHAVRSGVAVATTLVVVVHSSSTRGSGKRVEGLADMTNFVRGRWSRLYIFACTASKSSPF